MVFAGNLLWFVLGGGIFASLLWYLLGAVMAVTIVGIPFAKAAFRIATFAAFPFGRELIDGRLIGIKRLGGTALVNGLWILLAGLWLALSHILAGLACFISLIGIPFGIAHFKLASVCFAPLGKQIVSTEVAAEARARAARSELDRRISNA